MSKRLSQDEWRAVRHSWEYDPDEPTYAGAAERAAQKFGFVAPGRTTCESRAKKESWTRKGSMSGINEAAQRKADRLVNSDGRPEVSDASDISDGKKSDVSEIRAAMAARDESEDKRAEVLARHRQEWAQVAVLRQEALQKRHHSDATDAFNRMKLTKITAEATMIQQVGERRAWGMDTPDATDVSKMTDAQLEALIKGKAS